MGKIKKILEKELGSTQSVEVYPVTSIEAVYDKNNERLDNIINRKNKEIQKDLEAEVTRASNAESNLRETINNITEINENATSANIVTIDTIPNTSSSNVQQALNELFKNATFAGIATPTTNPGTPDGPVFYVATTAGSYSNFGNIEVLKGETAILKWNNGTWTKNAIKPITDFNSVFDDNGKSLHDKLSELEGNIGKNGINVYDYSKLAGFCYIESTHTFSTLSNINGIVVEIQANTICKASGVNAVYLFSNKPKLGATELNTEKYANNQVFFVDTHCYAMLNVNTSFDSYSLYVKSGITKSISELSDIEYKNILPTFGVLRDLTTQGVSFVWSDESHFHMEGTTDKYINYVLYDGNLPSYFVEGEEYSVEFSAIKQSQVLRLIFTDGNTVLKKFEINGKTNFIVPEGSVVMQLFIRDNEVGTKEINADCTIKIYDGVIKNIAISKKQDKLIAGNNIAINGNVISVVGGETEFVVPSVTDNHSTFPMIKGWIKGTDGVYHNSLETSYCASDFIEIPDGIDLMFTNANARKGGGVWCMYDSNKQFITEATGDTHIIKPIDGAKYIRVTHNGKFDGVNYPNKTIWWYRFATDNQPENDLVSAIYPLRGKVIAFSGDSITYGYDDNNDGNQLPNPWVNQVGELLKTTTLNYGMSSASLMETPEGLAATRQSILTEYPNYVDDIDIIGFMIGINDWFRGYPFGTENDNDDTTYLGCLNLLLQNVVKKWKPSDGKKIFICTYPHNDKTALSSISWEDWNEGIRKVSNKYSIPVCDVFNELGISVKNDTNGVYWNKSTLHSVHFLQAGADVFAKVIANFITSKFAK